MSEDRSGRPRRAVPDRERVPAFNISPAVLALIAVFALIHLWRTSLPEEREYFWLIDLALIPGCYEDAVDVCRFRDAGADLWTPLSHAFLHGDWSHLGVNALWMLAFGTPVERRIGSARFLLFFVVGALAGAGLFLLLNLGLLQPMIGASGAVSALMGGACRFALNTSEGPLGRDVSRAPRLSVREALRDRTVVIFALVFFLTNFALGSGVGALLGEESGIAWEAHIGGFLLGFLGFRLFDRQADRPLPPGRSFRREPDRID